MKAYELLADKSAWTQGAFGRDKEGYAVHEQHPTACRWCMLGAINRVYDGQQRENAVVKLSLALGNRGGETIAGYNDAPKRTHEEVVALLKELSI